jgi:hypothetical protein
MPTRHLAALLLTLLLAMPATATAAESPMPTRQAVAYGMDWVPYIDPADLPPVAERKVVCLVDSGVDITPDLPPDNFAGPIVERISVDGGSGLPGPAWENQHGTRMALIAGAVPGNDYGTVGAWPAVRILSVRAMGQDERVFPAASYQHAIRLCNDATSRLPVAAVNLSLGCACTMDDSSRAGLEDAIARVQAPSKDVTVIAAAGNSGGQLETPANAAGVLPVSGGDASGHLCPFSAHAPGVLIGPGCDVETAEGSVPVTTDEAGSSAASSFAAALIAVLRTLRPDATRTEAEEWLRRGANEPGGHWVLDGRRAAEAAGLGDVVLRATARMPNATGSSPVAPSSAPDPNRNAPTSSASTVLDPPKARGRWRARRLVLHVATVDAWSERLEIVMRRAGAFRRRLLPAGRTLRLRVRAAPGSIWLRWKPYAGAGMSSSTWTVLRRLPSGLYR